MSPGDLQGVERRARRPHHGHQGPVPEQRHRHEYAHLPATTNRRQWRLRLVASPFPAHRGVASGQGPSYPREVPLRRSTAIDRCGSVSCVARVRLFTTGSIGQYRSSLAHGDAVGPGVANPSIPGVDSQAHAPSRWDSRPPLAASSGCDGRASPPSGPIPSARVPTPPPPLAEVAAAAPSRALPVPGGWTSWSCSRPREYRARPWSASPHPR